MKTNAVQAITPEHVRRAWPGPISETDPKAGIELTSIAAWFSQVDIEPGAYLGALREFHARSHPEIAWRPFLIHVGSKAYNKLYQAETGERISLTRPRPVGGW